MGERGEGSGGKGGREVGNAYPPVHPLNTVFNVNMVL